MNRFRRALILLHRYLGIPLSVMFVVWFISGIVMIYAGGMPAVSSDEQLARRAPLELGAMQMSAADVIERAGIVAVPTAVRAQTVLGRPAWRIEFGFGRAMTLFADTAEILESVSEEAALTVAADYLSAEPSQISFVRTVTEPDQWTLTHRGSLPLHQFSVADGRGTYIYVSATDGEVPLVTTRANRFFSWIGVIPHWLYFTPLRLDQPLWFWTVVVLSALGCVLAVAGLILGVTQFHRSRPFSLNKSVRYRGWMRWHYYSGVLFGVFALTWVFSGLMSMEPFAWTNAQGLDVPRSALTGGELQMEDYPAPSQLAALPGIGDGPGIAELSFVRMLGEPYLAVTPSPLDGNDDAVRERLHQPYPLALDGRLGRLLLHAQTLEPLDTPFAQAHLTEAIRLAVPDVPIAATTLLDDYDSYYYSRDRSAPLPVVRIEFDDPMRTWYYVDPADARFVARTHRFSRIERWLFNGLHSLDFAFWYDKRPLWDFGMIALSLGALLSSAIGLYLGFRRLLPKSLTAKRLTSRDDDDRRRTTLTG